MAARNAQFSNKAVVDVIFDRSDNGSKELIWEGGTKQIQKGGGYSYYLQQIQQNHNTEFESLKKNPINHSQLTISAIF